MKRIMMLLASLALAVVIAGGVALAAPNTKTFANRNTIVINDATADTTGADIPSNATPYPSTIDVTGLSGTITDVNLTLKGFSHAFPADVSVTLEDPHGNQ